MVLGRAAALLGLGLALGLLLSWSVAGFLRTFLFQVSGHDWAVYAAVPGLLFVTGLAAAYVPARRAAHVDPLTALRAE
jgi:ABC-type antimicrobial peptide transport system permease subunit